MNEKYEIVKFIDGEFELDVNVSPSDETVWITQDEMAQLFGKARNTISEHINKIYKDQELDKNLVCRFFRHTGTDGKIYNVRYYNLDMIISVGFRVSSKRAIKFRIWSNKIIKEHLLKGYTLNANRVNITKDNYINLVNNVLRLDKTQEDIKNRLIEVENKIKFYDIPLDKIFFNGEFYDAYTLIEQIFESANEEIILMDSYVDRIVLDRLTKKKQNVNVIIYTKYNASRITQNDINAVNIQYPNISLIEVTTLHDRYIIIDKIKLYHVGASIKDAGRKTFSIHEIDNKLINTLLEGVN